MIILSTIITLYLKVQGLILTDLLSVLNAASLMSKWDDKRESMLGVKIQNKRHVGRL